MPTRHLGPVQMTADTAVIVSKRILEDGIPLEQMKFSDRPTIPIRKRFVFLGTQSFHYHSSLQGKRGNAIPVLDVERQRRSHDSTRDAGALAEYGFLKLLFGFVVSTSSFCVHVCACVYPWIAFDLMTAITLCFRTFPACQFPWPFRPNPNQPAPHPAPRPAPPPLNILFCPLKCYHRPSENGQHCYGLAAEDQQTNSLSTALLFVVLSAVVPTTDLRFNSPQKTQRSSS